MMETAWKELVIAYGIIGAVILLVMVLSLANEKGRQSYRECVPNVFKTNAYLRPLIPFTFMVPAIFWPLGPALLLIFLGSCVAAATVAIVISPVVAILVLCSRHSSTTPRGTPTREEKTEKYPTIEDLEAGSVGQRPGQELEPRKSPDGSAHILPLPNEPLPAYMPPLGRQPWALVRTVLRHQLGGGKDVGRAGG